MDVKSSEILTAPVEADDPALNILPSPDMPLKPGSYVFRLTVMDDLGQTSRPASFTVEVRDAPTVEIAGPSVVAFNQNISLTANAKTTGAIKTYTWTVNAG